MTDAEIEAVARLYCRKLGLDPDWVAPGSTPDKAQWTFFISRVRRALLPAAIAMSEAISEVRATVTEGGG